MAKLKKVKQRKITLNVPEDLLEAALQAGGDSLTETVRKGLALIAAKNSYEGLRALQGKVSFSIGLDEMREDR